MSNWRYTIDLSELWKQKEEEKITLQQLKDEVVIKLRVFANKYLLKQEWKEELFEIAQNFEDVDATIEEFDGVLAELYDWGDQSVPHRPFDNRNIDSKMCWIKTVF